GLLRRSLREAGRDATRFAIAKRVYLLVERDRAAGLRRLREWFGRYYGNASLADRVAVVGDVPTCVTELREVIAAGADLLLLNFVFDEFESLELVGREIAPALAEAERRGGSPPHSSLL